MIVYYIDLLRKNMKALVRVLIVYLIALVIFDITLSRTKPTILLTSIYAFLDSLSASLAVFCS